MRLEEMTIEDLIAEYNRHCPAQPLERWAGDKEELVAMVRLARKQSTPDGVVRGVSIRKPEI
jgi:hypothetical protein